MSKKKNTKRFSVGNTKINILALTAVTKSNGLGLGIHLFLKIPRLGDSEGPFQSSKQAENQFN